MKKIEAKFPGTRILVVEDYFINQEVIKEMLEIMQCNVDVAENGEEALEKFKVGDYKLVLMDIQMPIKDGFDTTREIRMLEANSGKHTIVVALTANALEGDREKCIKAGMDDYLSKPIMAENLEEMLNKHLVGRNIGQGT